ncbi:hypothetical protein K7185_20100 [Clostridium butyricum]|uniref:hypothetical protein n=1 Tax=Clostridium butyricum TaxID=1492 RepID=UPI001CA97313|nr:hypothetical protein [Clostridium butyricum]MBZ0314753.1 hypothetical protein [Clostridium butyricum]
MSDFESEIKYLVASQYGCAGATQSCKIEFKKNVCRELMKYLKKEDNVEIYTDEVGFPGTTSSARGRLILEEYNIEIVITVKTNSIGAFARYLGNESEIKDKEKHLIAFGGELVKGIMTSRQFENFESFLKVKVIEFIYELDKECNGKIINKKFDENIHF